ncbi:MAG: DNA-binding response OmpR family regulator/ligand-binding sensor domain-containing protein [Halioglobus sp.]|jgi:DNA-binding response OmpR family regulator/ligand-binding sensor domain-containing protein/nitrogen-specific signal transduction histidine kinase
MNNNLSLTNLFGSCNSIALFFNKLGLIIIVVIFCCQYAHLQNLEYFDNPIVLDNPKGLDVGTVSSIVVDKNGFLWIGGGNGLQRFDGYNFKKFVHNPKDSLSIISNNIRHLFYDKEENKLWISSWATQGGLSILDLESEKCKNYYHDINNPGGMTSSGLFWSTKDRFGKYWVGTKDGISKYNQELDIFSNNVYPTQPSKSKMGVQLSNKFICHTQDKLNDSLIWLGSTAGIHRFNVITGTLFRYNLPNDPTSNLSVRGISHHTNGWIYIGTWSDGLYRFNPKTKDIVKCKIGKNSLPSGSPLNKIKTLIPRPNNLLWINTSGGLVEYDTKEQATVSIKKNRPKEKMQYGINYIDENRRMYDLHKDQIFIYDPSRQQIKNYKFESEDKSIGFLPRRMLQDSLTGKIWIASQMSEGLYRVNLNTKTWETFPPPDSYFSKNKTFQCWDILQTKSGELLVLSSSTIFKFSKLENKLIPWEFQPKLEEPNFRRIIEDRKGNIWIGSHSAGLYKINTLQNVITGYKEELTNAEKPSHGAIWDLQEDRNGNIWIRSSGYSVYHAELDTFYNFPYFYPQEKVVYHIESLEKDGKGNVWICAHKNQNGYLGITDADHPNKGVVEYLDSENGLETKKPAQLLLDKNKNVWLLGKSLEKLSPEKNSEQFINAAYLPIQEKTLLYQFSNNNIAIGYRNGFGIFNPDSLRLPDETIYPYVHSFNVFDEPLEIKSDKHKAEVHLKPNQNFFSIQLSALNKSFFGDITFLYKLENVDPDWVQPQNRDYVSYTDIKGGDYVFKLKAKKNNGTWNEFPYKLHIHIATPWYRTSWAYLVWSILFFCSIYFLYKFQLSKKIAQKEADRLKELDEFKTRFYSNITHEFRTPLTVISGMADELKINYKKEPFHKIHLIKKNSQNLLALVNQMLDLSKLKAGKLTSDIKQNDVILNLKYLTEANQSFAKLKNVGLQFYSDENELFMDFDANQMNQVLNNLLSNAIKFTPEYGNILVLARIEKSNGKSFLEIKVKDSGIGISQEQIPFVFDRFHQLNPIHSNQGSGIGLALVKELLDSMNGEIKVESELNVGSTFLLRFPVTNNAPFSKNNHIKKLKKPYSPVVSETDKDYTDSDLPILLVIDDNPDVAYYLKTSLEDHYQIILAQNGKLGLEKAFKTLPDIIISDVMMPEMDGFEVCENLKKDERTSHIPVILLTAKATSEDKLAGLSFGADAYLIKPFEKEELMVRLDNLLEVRKTLQKKYSDKLLSSEDSKNTEISKEEVFVKKMEGIILENLENDDFSVHDLSRLLLLSRSQVHRKIKALTGMSTAIYIRHLRLLKAKELLISTDLPISDIAYQVGFKTLPYFSQAFKNTFGKSPSATRK